MKASLSILAALVLGALQVTTPPGASVSGRVKDSNGALLLTGSVMIGTLGYRDGRRAFIPGPASTQFDGRGNYRVMAVRPGEYFLRVEGPSLARGAPTYYPGTLDIDAAIAIPVQQDQEIVGIDFDVKTGGTFKVSGTLLNVPARSLPNGQPDLTILGFTLSSADPRTPDTGAPLLPNVRGGTKEFEISLPPGLWDIFPVIPLRIGTPPAPTTTGPMPPTYATGRARVLVRDRDVENVEVSVTSAEIKGRIVVSGSSPTENNGLSVTRVGLLPTENYPSPLIMHLRQQMLGTLGEFAFTAVPPGKYALQVSPLPAEMYIADIRVGSKSVYDNGVINVGADPIDPVEVVLSRGGGVVRVAISGTVSSAASPSLSRIALIPAPPRRGNALLYKTLAYSGSPAYASFNNVAPGRYKVFAFQDLPAGGAEQNAEFMARYEDSGVAVDVAPGQIVDVQAQWIPPKP